MKSAAAFSLALVLSSMTLFAQNSGRYKQTAVAPVVPGSTNCPINMSAQKQTGLRAMRRVSPGAHPKPQGPAQDLRLSLKNSTFQEIVGLQITAYGFNSKPQLYLGRTTSANSSTIHKTVDLKLKVDPKSEASINLLLPEFTSVTLLNVDSIHYAGGSTWHPSAVHTCRVVPDGMMLISSR
ncbi:MAG: hypothetical protein ACRD28_08110 [Acidobacteriaceae bacterium]